MALDKLSSSLYHGGVFGLTLTGANVSKLRTGFSKRSMEPSPVTVITGKAARRIANVAAHQQAQRDKRLGFKPLPVELFVSI